MFYKSMSRPMPVYSRTLDQQVEGQSFVDDLTLLG